MTGIVDYGMGNVRSVQKALEFIGEKSVISGEKAVLDGCDKLILPGVGSFGEGMRELNARSLPSYLAARAEDTDILGICLGMQFLLTRSFEDGENAGLGFCQGDVVRFTEGKVPQIGWNQVYALRSPLFDKIAEESEFYFVHSYRAETTDFFTAAKCRYYVEYAAAVWNGKHVYGTQFHPEKSGGVGIRLLQNFLSL